MSGSGLEDFPSLRPEPISDLLWILEHDGWHEVEFDLFARSGRTLADIESLLTAADAELEDTA